MSVAAFFINLDRSTDRLALMREQERLSGLTLERVAAYLGRNTEPDLRWQFDSQNLSDGECGCYASHLKACHAVLQRELPHALVLEDDVVLPPGVAEYLRETVAAAPAGWDIIKLCNRPKRPVYTIAELRSPYRIVRFYRQPPLAGAYLVSNAGARKLTEPRPRVRPYDMEFRQPWNMGLEMYGVCPPLIRQRHDMESDIGKLGARRRSGPLYRAPFRTFDYALRRIGLLPTLACRLVEWTALIGIRAIGKAWI